jgi:hypothetical protein
MAAGGDGRQNHLRIGMFRQANTLRTAPAATALTCNMINCDQLSKAQSLILAIVMNTIRMQE